MMHWRPKAWDASMRRAKLLVASAAGAGRWFSVGYGNSPVMHCGIASLLRGRLVMGAGRWFSVGLWQRPDEALVSPSGDALAEGRVCGHLRSSFEAVQELVQGVLGLPPSCRLYHFATLRWRWKVMPRACGGSCSPVALVVHVFVDGSPLATSMSLSKYFSRCPSQNIFPTPMMQW